MININENIKIFELDSSIENKLKSNKIITINDLWKENRKSLKNKGFSDKEINKISIKLELIGLELNNKNNDIDRLNK